MKFLFAIFIFFMGSQTRIKYPKEDYDYPVKKLNRVTSLYIYQSFNGYRKQAASYSRDTTLERYKFYFDNNLKKWTLSYKNFNLSAFKAVDTTKFETSAFGDIDDLKNFYELYKRGLSFSEDKSKFIDIYSYWLNLEKKGNKIVDNPEVDQAVSLCDLVNKKWVRIYFCGLAVRIEEVVWVSKTKFILAGSIWDDNNNSFHPQVLIGDLKKQIFLIYINSLSIAGEKGYTSPKLKKLNIQEN